MPLIVLEGCDGSGKTTVINQLIKKYSPTNPKLIKMAFPIDRALTTERYNREDKQEVIDHHLRFFEEFKSKQRQILDLLKQDYTILLDRYTMSFYVYFMIDYLPIVTKRYSHNDDEGKIRMGRKTSKIIIDGLMNKVMPPDMTIYLFEQDTQDENILEIQNMYNMIMMHVTKKSRPKNHRIPKDKYTFVLVESLLKQNKYI
jgi:uridine kinase